MKKRALIFFAILSCIVLLTTVVSAHSGRTDSNGGHYDHSTGKYHYHHGYSAHQHYDMDGDGVKDCPHDFEDKTKYNNNNEYNLNNKTNDTPSKPKNNITFGKIAETFLLLTPISLLILWLLHIILGLINIMVGFVVEKCLKININTSLQETIFRVLLIIGTVTIVVLWILFNLEIL